MFVPHPSRRLTELFARKPYQGADPAEAAFVFIGLDANYAADIEDSPSFSRILEYHEDGVAFWRRTGVHHPFLLQGYRGDGKRYHQAFARIGFEPRHAHLVSFVELLQVPTVGISALEPSDLRAAHLTYVNDVVCRGRAQHVFLSSMVLRHMQRSGCFPWARPPARMSGPLPVVHRSAKRVVYQHLHFSYQWGKVDQLRAEAAAIAALIPRIGVN